MKNFSIKTALVAAFSTIALGAAAQNTLSGYFVDDYLYRFQMNPAMANDQRFVAFPGLGNLNIGVHGNLHLTSVLYNVNGKTSTFMNPNVSVQEVLSNIHDKNKIGTTNTINILSGGWKAWGGYNTINIGTRVSADVMLPGALFSLLKEGVANKDYNIGNLSANAYGYAQIALGHSRNITPDLRVGATFKFLVGGGWADAVMKDTRLTLGEDDWQVQTNAEIHANVKGLTYDTDVNENTGHRYVSGADVDGAGVGGYGMAFDLGAVYKTPVEGLTVSAAVLDLGFIKWNTDMLATTNGLKTFNTDKYTFNVDDNAPNSFDNEWDKIKDDLSALYELDDAGDQGGRTKALHATVNIGVEYELPYYRQLTFGLLNSTRVAGDFTCTDFRLSANIAPCKVFSAGINMGVGTFGMSFGWIANVHLKKGFNMFIGSDHTPGKLAKQGVPLSSNMQVNFGLNVPF